MSASPELALAGNPQPPAAAPVPDRARAAVQRQRAPSPLLASQPPAPFCNKRFRKGRMLGPLRASTSPQCSLQQGQGERPSPQVQTVFVTQERSGQSWQRSLALRAVVSSPWYAPWGHSERRLPPPLGAGRGCRMETGTAAMQTRIPAPHYPTSKPASSPRSPRQPQQGHTTKFMPTHSA